MARSSVVPARLLASRRCCSFLPSVFPAGLLYEGVFWADVRRASAWASSLPRWAAARASVTFFEGRVGCFDVTFLVSFFCGHGGNMHNRAGIVMAPAFSDDVRLVMYSI